MGSFHSWFTQFAVPATTPNRLQACMARSIMGTFCAIAKLWAQPSGWGGLLRPAGLMPRTMELYRAASIVPFAPWLQPHA